MRIREVLAAALAAVPSLAQTEWQRLPLLEHLRYPAFCCDWLRGEAVLFGGDTGSATCGDTWLWDHSRWRRAAAAAAPAARCEAAMAFDGPRGVVLLFGGRGAGYQYFADTWQWDGSAWTQLLPANAPPARALHAMAGDAPGGTVLLFGGGTPTTGELADTWEWNGSDWTQRQPLHAPGRRSGASLATDLLRQRVVLFGGSCFALGPCWRGDTWEWDGSDWLDRTPAPPAASPPPRWSHVLAFDPARGRTLLFGGSDDPGHYKDDTWQWDGSAWTELLPANRPVGRLGAGGGYDPQLGQVLVCGGESWVGLRSDLFGCDGVDWRLHSPGMQPPLAVMSDTEALAFDGEREAVVWCAFDYGAWQTETWEWDGAVWRLSATGGPRYAEQLRLQWLPPRHRVVLYQPQRSAAQPEQTWEYDGAQWTQLLPPHQPGVHAGASLALDPRFDRLLLFGGRDAQGLRASSWTFDGLDWQPLAVAGPPARDGHAMALDVSARRVLLFGGDGGSGVLGDTWTFDGQRWLQLQPANAPPARRGHAMAFDFGRQRLVLHGGIGSAGNLSDTWEWTGSDWLLRPTAGSRQGSGHGLAADLRGDGLLAFGGYVAGTWRYAATMPGGFASFGQPCGGSLGVPLCWTAFGERPYGGGSFTLRFGRLPGSVALAALGLSASWYHGAPLPLNLGAFGYPRCDLLVEPAVLVALPASNGDAAWTLPIPPLPALVGMQLFAQAMAPDAAGADGLAMTPGAALRIGGR